jgi:hypothetical protein
MNLITPDWNAAGSAADDGTNRFIIVSPAAGHRFYRLVNP